MTEEIEQLKKKLAEAERKLAEAERRLTERLDDAERFEYFEQNARIATANSRIIRHYIDLPVLKDGKPIGSMREAFDAARKGEEGKG